MASSAVVVLAATATSAATVAGAAGSGGAGEGERLVPFRQALEVGNDFRSPRLTDLDGDGHVDGVIADGRAFDATGIILRWGSDAGRLGSRAVVGVPGPVDFVAVADLDGDGDPDFVAVDRAARRFWFVTQGTPRAFFTSGSATTDGLVNDLRSVDLTGDGIEDVLVTFDDAQLALVRSVVGGPPVLELLPSTPSSQMTVVPHDVDDDGDPDLVAVRRASPAPIGIAFNDGRGGFSAFSSRGSELKANDVLPLDVGQDGVTELIVSGRVPEAIDVLRIDATGTIISELRVHLPQTPDRLVAARGPGGATRVITTSQGHPIVGPMLLLRDVAGHGLTYERTFSGNGDVARRLAVGDVDGNGVDDIAVESYRHVLLFDRPDGGFGPSIDLAGGVTFAVLEDFDGDGDLDLAGLGGWPSNDRLRLIENDGRGRARSDRDLGPGGRLVALMELDGQAPREFVTFPDGSAVAWRLDEEGRAAPVAAALAEGQEIGDDDAIWTGDVTGDGLDDLVLSGDAGIRVLGYVPGHGFVRLADGRTSAALDPVGEAGAPPEVVAVGDVDGDGLTDLVIERRATGFSLLLALGQGSFGERPLDGAGTDVEDLRLLDLTADGILDLVVSRRVWPQPSVEALLRGRGDGTFEPLGPLRLPPLTSPREILTVDHDGDGLLDVMGARDPWTGERRLGLGDGRLDYTNLVPGAMRLSRGVAGDWDADGDQDLVGSAANRLMAMLNGGDERRLGDATADRRVDVDDLLAVLAAWGPCACPADQDGDGVVDERDLMIVLGAWDVAGGS